MREENLQLMNQKKSKEEMERSFELQNSNTTPVQIGDGYQRQLAAMQQQEMQK